MTTHANRQPPLMKMCEHCAGTGFSDKVNRGIWTMEPREKVCPECFGRGWKVSPPMEEIDRLRATLLNIQALAERGFPIDHTKLAEQCRRALTSQ